MWRLIETNWGMSENKAEKNSSFWLIFDQDDENGELVEEGIAVI